MKTHTESPSTRVSEAGFQTGPAIAKAVKGVLFGVGIVGFLLGNSARAQVGLQDGSLTSAATSDNSATVSQNFTVSPGASVLVVSLYDRSQAQGQSPTSLQWGSQTMTRAVSQNNTVSHYADSDIFYLFNPAPGTQTITATDTSGTTPSAMTMQVYTLDNVNTNVPPMTYQTSSGDMYPSLSLTLGSNTPSGAWAVVTASAGDSGGGNFNMTSTSGALTYDYVVNNQSQIMGGVANLAAGATVLTENNSCGGCGPQSAFVAAVFTPAGQINLQDGSTNLVTTASSPISTTFTVTPGAEVLVVNLFDRNGEAGNLSPASLAWGSQTLTRVISENNAASTYADSDIYYLYDPVPGTQTITATDTSGGSISAMTMQVFTINGVDTNAPIATYATNYNGTTSVSVTLSNSTVPGSWAIINSSYGSGNTVMFDTSSSGVLNCPEVQNDTSQCMGYASDLSGGDTTITANASPGSGTQKMALAVAVFSPPITGPPPPTNLVATAGTNKVFVSWDDASGGLAGSYILLRSTTSGNSYLPIATNTGNASTSYTDTNVVDYTTYYYVVQGEDNNGTSLYSAQAGATPVNVPLESPVNLVATAQTNRVSLSWADGSGGRATNYIILRSTINGSGYLPIATNYANSDTTYTDTTVYDATTYYYVVESFAGAPSAPSAQAGATPFFALPAGEAGTIKLLDGGTSSIATVANGAGSTVSENFTVSQGASVMVIELWDRNTENNHSSPTFITWSNTTTGTAQTAIRAVSEVSGASTYSDCDIYYLFNPTPGSGTVSGTDTNTVTIQGLTMMVFDLAGVNTTVPPSVYATNGSSATTLSVTTASTTPAGAYAAVISYDGNSGESIVNASSSGASTYQDVANNQEQALGYVANLAGGGSTISMTDAGGAAKCTLAAAVFAPAIGTGIYFQDGSTNGVSTTSTTISEPFAVTAGASVLVVALYDNNNTGPNGVFGPSTLVWSNESLGTTQLLQIAVDENTTAYTWTWADLYYLYDPFPGDGVIIGTDTNSSFMYMQAYTLGGVDTTVAPYAVGIGNGGASVLQVTTSPTQLFGSWAPVISVNYNGGGGNNITITADSGGAVEGDRHPNGLQVTAGYLTNLAAGSSTITATATGTATHMDLAAEVFSPLAGTGAPIDVTATSETNRILLTWADGSSGVASGYIILRSTTNGSGFVAIATNAGNGSTTYLDTNLADWTTYYYEVQAEGPGGLSLYSSEVATNAVGLATTPVGLTATAGINQVSLTWSRQLGASVFDILRSTTSGSGFSIIGTSPTSSFTDTSVVDGTLYYYELVASNNFGASAKSAQVSAVPVVAFFTNYIGIFDSSDSVDNWVTINDSPDAQFFQDAPSYGPSTGCFVFDANYGPGSTDEFAGLATNMAPAINVSTYPNLEVDIKNEGTYDQYGQIQGIQFNLQVPVGGAPTYEQGNSPSITLYETATGGQWTHYVIPISDWAAYNLASVTGFGINIFDANYSAANEMDVGFDNIAFTGAPAWNAVFTSLSSPTIATGSTTVTLTGKVLGIVAGTNIYLASNTLVTVTINGNVQTTAVNDATGDFSVAFDTTGFANGTYPITYVSASDQAALVGATNTSTSLTITTVVPPPSPTIAAPSIDSTGTNLVVRVPTVSGHTYYLVTTTNLEPPVVWTTNASTPGTGGTITNLAPIIKSQPDLFLRYEVQ